MRNLTISDRSGEAISPSVFSARDTYTASDAALWNNITTKAFQVRGPRIFGYAPGLAAALEASDAEILHIHGIWMYPSVVALRWSQGSRPYVVSPHGLLRPWALRNSRWKKRIAATLYEDMHLRRAACLHVLNAAEAESFREYGLKNPIFVISNGDESAAWLNSFGAAAGPVILYLGRFHPSKGLRSLLEAWSAVCKEAETAGWRLKLAGWDQNNHRAELEQFADQLQIRSRPPSSVRNSMRTRSGALPRPLPCSAQQERRLACKHSRSVVMANPCLDDS